MLSMFAGRGELMNAAFITAVILLICAVSSKVLYRFGIPILILFLTIGMLMGSEGPGGIYFDNAALAENICNLALLIIIFSGGLTPTGKQPGRVLWLPESWPHWESFLLPRL